MGTYYSKNLDSFCVSCEVAYFSRTLSLSLSSSFSLCFTHPHSVRENGKRTQTKSPISTSDERKSTGRNKKERFDTFVSSSFRAAHHLTSRLFLFSKYPLLYRYTIHVSRESPHNNLVHCILFPHIVLSIWSCRMSHQLKSHHKNHLLLIDDTASIFLLRPHSD